MWGLAHAGYGAAMGAAYALVLQPLGAQTVPGAVRGATFGLALWAASYAGWIPALELMPPPARDAPGRQASLVGGHLVYGAVLGQLAAATR